MLSHAALSRAEQDAQLVRYVGSLPGLVERLRARFAGSGVVLDGSIDSLDPLGWWYWEALLRDEPGEGGELPVWWNPERVPRGEPGAFETAPFFRSQLRLIDEVQAYVATVLVDRAPAAEWVVFRPRDKREAGYGEPRLVLAPGATPLRVLGIAYYMALDAMASEHQVDGTFLRWSVQRRLAEAGLGPAAPPWSRTDATEAPVTPGATEVPVTTGPQGESGDLVVLDGSFEAYVAGPEGLPRLDEGAVVAALTRLGVGFEDGDDEGQWELGTVVCEVWLERDGDGGLVAVGFDPHRDALVDPGHEIALVEGVLQVAAALRARAYSIEGEDGVPLAR